MAYGLVDEDVEKARSRACRQTRLFVQEGPGAGIPFKYLGHGPVLQCLSAYLKEVGYRTPDEDTYTAVHKAYGMPSSEYLQKNPEVAKILQKYMAAQRADQTSCITNGEVFPHSLFKLIDDDDKDRFLFVDAGGGVGHQCVTLRQHHPGFRGRIILQELPRAIANADLSLLEENKIEWVEHDATLPQPIKGDKIYYMRNVMHNWPDAKCRTIHSHLRDASVGHVDSAVVIDDIVMLSAGATWKQLNYDISMLMLLNAMERTQEQWKALVESAGLKLELVMCSDEEKADTLIICRPPAQEDWNGRTTLAL